MEDNNQLSFPEEEEDLEALRLAALQSLKKKTNNDPQIIGHFGGGKDKLYFNGSPRGKHKRGKFVRVQQGRQLRGGQFNGWSRNSNLIAVPMINEDEKLTENKTTAADNVPKLILPQDRYCKLETSPEKTDTLTSSKFDRYDNSDESEEESEDDDSKSETEDKPELKRANSLEELMAELENEIHGVPSKPAEETKPTKPKQIKKKRKVSVNAPAVAAPPTPPEDNKQTILKENLKPELITTEIKKPQFPNRQRKWQNKPRPRHYPPPPPLHPPIVPPPPEIIPPIVPFVPPPVQTFPPYNPPIAFDNAVYVPPVVFEAPPPPQLPPPIQRVPPPVYERPLSPLSINTDAFSMTNTSLGQLSPRSAAFVLENRKIIEKRKRRSWSRSPSPPVRFRRSKSPKRLSVSPKRLSKSPKRRSLSPSPIRKVLPPRTNSPNKKTVHDRLGIKSKSEVTEDKTKEKEKPSPTKKEEKKEEILDPVLEARRRKFERNEIRITEGVIRLKKPMNEDSKEKENSEKKEEEIDEDALLEGDEVDLDNDSLLLDHNTLFSDEETDSDNEGRFKTKQENQANQKVAILPFTKLINGTKSEVKQSLLEEKRNSRRRSPVKKMTTKGKKESKVKQAIGFSDRKIEIKIRNPAKYERAKSSERKVEVAKKEEENEAEGVEEGGEEGSNANLSEGDLRAQLSRKRAERQKHPLPDVVPSRLLQNALQGVGFRKGKKTKNKDEVTDGKLPIHLRLGAANGGSEVFGKKSRKQKNKGSPEQV